MEEQQVIEALSALAQETRLRIFRMLVRAGLCGMSPGQLGESLGIPAATLSFHLKEMRHAGIVASRRQGRSLLYSADFRVMSDLMGYLMENCCQAESEVGGVPSSGSDGSKEDSSCC